MGRRRRAGCVVCAVALVPALASAAPEGEQVRSGEATFTRDGTTTQITTSTRDTIVDYTSFDIGLGETVRIDQPDAASRILNNVLSTDPTHIDGVLTSNGQVWIANPVGVFFGNQAIVDVGRLVAGAGKVDAAEFLAGSEHWSELTGSVEVGAGAQLRAAESVLLVGAAVANYGHVSASDGMVALVAGGGVRLARVDGRVMVTADPALAPDPARWGVVQGGTVDAGRGGVSLVAGDAYSLAINHTGITRARDIEVAGGDGGLVSVSGALDASSQQAGETGGRITVTGDRVLVDQATLDASGPAGGGEIRVGGDYQGGGALPTARRTYVSDTATLRADATQAGNGGRIIVWADEATRFYGAVSARGGPACGDGGFAEISGASLVAQGSVDLGATNGRVGTLLYDPKDIVLHDGDNPSNPNGERAHVFFGEPDEATTPFDFYVGDLERDNADVILQATNSINSLASDGSYTIVLDNGRSISVETRNATGDATGSSFTPGIHLAGVSFTTTGGKLSFTTGDGDIELAGLSTRGADGAAGGSGGAVTISAGGTGSVAVNGAIDARGGNGTAGAGGDGGIVSITASGGTPVGTTPIDPSISVAAIDVSGGNGAGGVHGGRGGNGGTIALVADIEDAATPPAVATEHVIAVNGTLKANGGTGSAGTRDADAATGGAGGQIRVSAGIVAERGNAVVAPSVQMSANGGNGAAGGGSTIATSTTSDNATEAIRVEAHDQVTVNAGSRFSANGGNATSSGNGGKGGDIAIVSKGGDATFSGTLISQGGTALGVDDDGNDHVDGTPGRGIVEGHGDIDVTLAADTDLEQFEVNETLASGNVSVQGLGIDAHGAADPVDSTAHRVSITTTDPNAPEFTYRLSDGGDGDADQPDLHALTVAGVNVGAGNGVAIVNARRDATSTFGERLLGRVEGVAGATPSIVADGDVQVRGTAIGTQQQLSISAGTADVELTASGDVDAAVSDAGRVILNQRSAAGSARIDLASTDDAVKIDGTVVDDGINRTETSVVSQVDTTLSGIEFAYRLTDDSASSDEPASGEPDLRIARGAVDLGGDASFSTTGDLILERVDEPGVDPGTAIEANGHAVTLEADSNHRGDGAIVASTRGTTDVADASALTLLAGSGVGADAPIRTSGAVDTELVGRNTAGAFRVAHTGTGALEIASIATDADGLPSGGVSVTGVDNADTTDVDEEGDVELSNPTGGIRFVAADSTDTLPDPDAPQHVVSGGSQTYSGPVQVAADAVLAATRGVTFTGDVDSSGVTAHDLTVTTGTETTFAGNVGAGIGGALDTLTTRDVRFTAGDHAVNAHTADLGGIEGAGARVTMRGDAGSAITIRDDIGADAPLARFDADASLLVFGARTADNQIQTSADHISADEVALNAVPGAVNTGYATIADTDRGLAIDSKTDVTIGAGEKLSVTGPLAIRAGDTATVGDLAATDIEIDADHIAIQGRAPGPVALPDGNTIPDAGPDWVANNIRTNVVPQWDGVESPPTFALGNGGIDLSGPVPHDLVRFTAGVGDVKTSSFAGTGGRVLDLTGTGQRVVSDARSDLPRRAPEVLPALAARPGEDAPSPPREVRGEEVVGALHCRGGAGDCAPPAIGDDPLDSERAQEIVSRYRRLVGSDEGRRSVSEAFAPLRARGVSGAALPHALASDPSLGPARERVGELAITLTQIELLGLAESESERARHTVASEFASAADVPDLDADAVLAAVAASGVAAMPKERATR